MLLLNFMTCGAALNTAPAMDVPWHIDAIFITQQSQLHFPQITCPLESNNTATHISRSDIAPFAIYICETVSEQK
jgi:hypothetical protein